MTRKGIWISLIGLVVLAGLWLAYRTWVGSARGIEKLIPKDALLVLASATLQDTVPVRILRTEMPLRQAPVFQEAVQRLERFLYTVSDTSAVVRFLSHRPVYYSLHPESPHTLNFIFYIPLRVNQDRAFLDQLKTPDPRKVRVLSHSYDTATINELRTLQNEVFGSYLLTNDYLIGSASGILIENVIRHMNQPLSISGTTSFQIDTDHLASFSVRPEVLQELFGASDAGGSLVHLFLPEVLNLQFRSSSTRTHLIGYASDQIGARQDIARLFSAQTPLRIASADMIPQTVATLYHIGVSDSPVFGRDMSDLLMSSSSPTLQNRLSRMEAAAGAVYQNLSREVLLCRLESPGTEPRQILLLKAVDLKKLSDGFQRTAFLAGAPAPKTLKSFLGHKTLLLDVPELPASLFSSLFTGFKQSWVTQHNQYLVVANSEEAMQDYLQQLSRGTVWSADKNKEALLNQTLRPANFTAFVLVNRAQTALPANWPVGWRNLLNHPASSLDNIENMVYQASYGKEKILSTLVLGRTTRRAGDNVLNRLLLKKKFVLDEPLNCAPILAGRLADGSTNIWAQTQSNQFYVLTAEGDKIPQGKADGPVRSNVLAVDYLDNGRIQNLFMTNRNLYIADPGFQSFKLRSIPLPNGLEPTFMALPSGSRQRNLVALAAHRDGSIYALDRQKNRFVRIFSARLRQPLLLPFQVNSTPGGMEVLALQSNGLLNRWVEAMQPNTQAPHFPAQLDSTFISPALEPGPATGIRLISEQGELLRLNNNGLIASRAQLYRPVRNGSFRLCPNDTQTGFVLLRTTDTEVAVLDNQGQQLFEVRGLKPGHQIRYHRLGSGVELLSILSGRFTTLYSLNGRVIGDRGIPGDFPVALQYDDVFNQLTVVSGTANTVQLYSIRLR